LEKYTRKNFSAYLEDCDYKGYKIYAWVENLNIRYFYLQTNEDYTKTFNTLSELYEYIDMKEK
jgi:hypothetical protein